MKLDITREQKNASRARLSLSQAITRINSREFSGYPVEAQRVFVALGEVLEKIVLHEEIIRLPNTLITSLHYLDLKKQIKEVLEFDSKQPPERTTRSFSIPEVIALWHSQLITQEQAYKMLGIYAE